MALTARSLRTRAPSAAAMLAVAALLLGACGDDDGGGDAGGFVEARRVPAQHAAGLAAAPDGTLVVGELMTGEVSEIDPVTGESTPRGTVEPLETTPTQRGLLGLAVTDDGEVLAGFVNGDDRIEVAALDADGSRDRRWLGPSAQNQANGGRLALLPDDRVVIGIGDLLDPDLIDDPDAPNGKLLDITDGGDGKVIAGSFNNPFALTAADDGTLWVADNAPGAQPERLMRVGTDGEVETLAQWDETRVPVGAAVLDDGRLALCNYATTELRLVDPDDPGDGKGELLADDCRYAVIALPDGGVAYAAEEEVVVLTPEA
ncbi:hypothetical protein BH20ACT3_BH20ACT3_15780 [soil metagenome]